MKVTSNLIKSIGFLLEKKLKMKDLKFIVKQLQMNANDKDYYQKLKAKISKKMHMNGFKRSGSIIKAYISTKQILDERQIESGRAVAEKSSKIYNSKYSTVEQRQYHSQFQLRTQIAINNREIRPQQIDNC